MRRFAEKVGNMRLRLTLLALMLVSLTISSAYCGLLTDYFEQGKERSKTGDYDGAILAFTSALESCQPQTKNYQVVMLSRARAYLSKGETASAWRDLNQVMSSLNLDGDTTATALNLKGTMNQKAGRESQAMQDFTAAIKTPHSNQSVRASSFANRGILHLNSGNAGAALSDFNKAVELEPNYAFAYAGRGMAHLRTDNTDAAKKDVSIAMRLEPDQATTKLAQTVLDQIAVPVEKGGNITVPISESGHVFVQLRFAKYGKPHRFMLDTGATYTLVSNALLEEIKKEINVEVLGTSKVKIADGSIHTVTRYRVKDAYLYNLPLGELEFHSLNKSNFKNEVANLFGVRGFHNVSVSLDYARKKVDFKRKGYSEIE
jgi:tetratricopeptide (TPR) repeat protein